MITILHLDDQLIILDKPAGLPVLPEGWEKDAPCLLKMLEDEYGRIWVVHRLDKVTSGVMIFARTAEAHRSLNVQFERRQVEKIYHAIVTGLPPWEEKTTRFPLRANVGHSHRTAVDDRKGKPAETHFRVLKRGQEHALLEAHPTTGRTHQIRVHAYALGFPLLGDTLYGNLETDLISRPCLHAWSLRFARPSNGEVISFQSPHPPDFEGALRRVIENPSPSHSNGKGSA
jgi:RluA family pseudouridine synthase